MGGAERKVILISVGKMSPDDPPRLQQSDGISVSMLCSADSAGDDNRSSVLEPAATLEP